MQPEHRINRLAGRTTARTLIAVAAIGVIAIATVGLADAAAPMGAVTKRVVKKAHNRKLGRTILVNLKGHTLYSLSAEKHGRFICTDSTCLSVWHPLKVPSGTTPTGPVKLGTIKRPDGSTQVRYRGLPSIRSTATASRGRTGARDSRTSGPGTRPACRGRAARAPVDRAPSPDRAAIRAIDPRREDHCAGLTR